VNNLDKDYLAELNAALSRERDIYRNLLQLAYEKKDVLIKNDVSALNEIVKKEVESLKKLKALEKKREDAFSAVCAGLGCNASVSCLIERLEGKDKTELEAIVLDFSDMLKNLSDANDNNQRLLQTHLKLTEMNMRYLSEDNNEFTYESTGRFAPEPARTIIDQKV
jgi:flagellar biosynthesis/type III secretory pathway chaperone